MFLQQNNDGTPGQSGSGVFFSKFVTFRIKQVFIVKRASRPGIY